MDELVRVEVEREDSNEIVEIAVPRNSDMLGEVRARLGLEAHVHIFERDRDEPLDRNIEDRRHLRLLAHPHRALDVVVRYEHQEKDHRFAPSATVFKVLQWAVGKKGYNLDPTAAAKANLILPGAEEPLPRDRTIGSFTKPGSRRLVVDLTLKDFTNG
ncbi:MAG: hypothetical protein AB7V46_24390 [Thermomicrobiales bacterium]